MKKTIIAAVCTLGVVGTATAVSAAPRGPGGGFDRMDANGDGVVTAAEMDAQQAELIAAADANGDGGVSKEEMRSYRKTKREEWRAQNNPDANGDGVVDRIEFQAAADKRFDRMDKDGDGVLSEDERRQRRGFHRRGHRGE